MRLEHHLETVRFGRENGLPDLLKAITLLVIEIARLTLVQPRRAAKLSVLEEVGDDRDGVSPGGNDLRHGRLTLRIKDLPVVIGRLGDALPLEDLLGTAHDLPPLFSMADDLGDTYQPNLFFIL